MPAKKPLLFKSLQALGDALGVAKKTAWEYVTNPTWPFGKSPWPAAKLSAMKEWRDALPGRQQEGAGERATNKTRDLTDARIHKLVADIKGKQLDTAIKAKKFHNAEECLIRRLNALHQHKQDLYMMVDGLPLDPKSKGLVSAAVKLLGDLSKRYAAMDKPTRDQVRGSLERILREDLND